jgi:alkylated DNA repair dioxygenase AlkB
VSPLELPEGLFYEPEFLSEEEQADLVAELEGLEFEEVRMRGQTARRTVRHFGVDYEYEGGRITPGEPLPASLEWLRERSAALAGLDADDLAQTLVSRYPPHAGIGWHRDAPMFGSKIVGVSLLSESRLRLRPRKGVAGETVALELEPRSAYVLGGPARSEWEHSISPTKALRYSLTFRPLKRS